MRARRGRAVCGDPSAPVELYYEDIGARTAPAVLLIMGVGAQLPMWPDGFCKLLVKRGYRVIRFDHRDIGLSTKMSGQRAEGSVVPRIGRYLLGRPSPVPYTLVDMAQDAEGLLDHLGIESAHVVGASMGGMIAQILAGMHPERVRSLALLMTSSGKPLSALPSWRVIRLALNPPGKDAPRAAKVAVEMRNIAVINGPNFLPTDDQLRHRVETLDRAQRLQAGRPAAVRRDPWHRQPAALHPSHHRADGRGARVARSDDANSQRPQPRSRHRGRAVHRRRRHGPRSARAGVAPGGRRGGRERR